MKIIESKVEKIIEMDLFKKIELCGRVCYKSEDKIGNNSIQFFRRLLKNGHTSVLEHVRIIIDFNKTYHYCNETLGSSHELPLSIYKLKSMLTLLANAKCDSIKCYNTIVEDECLGMNRIFFHKDNYGLNISNKITMNLRDFFETLPKYGILTQFEDKIKEFNQTQFDLLENMFNLGFVELDPNYLTVRVITDRAIANEIVRHRCLSFSQESTRYVNYGNTDQIEVIKPSHMIVGTDAFEIWLSSVDFSLAKYKDLIKLQVTPQTARSVLPHCLKTEIIISGTITNWKKFTQLRSALGAHPDIQSISKQIEQLLEQN